MHNVRGFIWDSKMGKNLFDDSEFHDCGDETFPPHPATGQSIGLTAFRARALKVISPPQSEQCLVSILKVLARSSAQDFFLNFGFFGGSTLPFSAPSESSFFGTIWDLIFAFGARQPKNRVR